MELTAPRSSAPAAASQTLARGLDVLEQVATGGGALGMIAAQLGLSRTTVHRLASSLVERRYLNLTPRQGYSLGPKLLELGSLAGEQIALLRAAAPIMEALAGETGDAVQLCVRDGHAAVLAGCVGSRRRLAPRLLVGERQDLSQSAAGLALLLDAGADELAALWKTAGKRAAADRLAGLRAAGQSGIVLGGLADDSEITTMAAPVRGADGRIVAALGVAIAAPYRAEGTSAPARQALIAASSALSAELGWRIMTEYDPGHDSAPGPAAARELLECGTASSRRRTRAASAAPTTK